MRQDDNKSGWDHEMQARQRNLVFPDTTRNLGTFYRGIYEQKLSAGQWVGFGILLLFYIALITALGWNSWPKGDASLWRKIIDGYWIYFLFCLPLLGFFLLIRRMARRESARIDSYDSKAEKD